MYSKYAVLIGINEYHESLGTLKYCVSDAELMHETLMSEQCGFSQDNTLLLTDNQDSDKLPTYGNIHSWLGKWLSLPEKDDLVVVYFAGHGRHDKGESMLVPADATLDTVGVTGIKVSYVQDLLERCKAKQKVLFLDACHSGSGRDVMPMTAQFYNQLQSSEGIYTIASCKQDQISHECDERQHGIFTWSLTDAIKMAVPSNDGNVTLDAIYDKCRRTIADWCKPRRITQNPVRISSTTGEITLTTRNTDVATQLNQAREEISSLKEELFKQQKKQIEYSTTTVRKRGGKGQRKAVDSLHVPSGTVKSVHSIVVKCEHCYGTGICRNDQASGMRGGKGIACLVCWKKADTPGDLRQPITCSVCGGSGRHTLVKPIEKCIHCNGRGVCLNDTASFLRGKTPIPCIPCWKAAGSPGDLKRVVPCNICKGVGSVAMGESQ